MSSRIGWFVLGIVATLLGIVAGGYLFIRFGGMPMETSGKALRASIGNAMDTKNPLPVDETNLLVAADLYSEHCSVCHGIPGRPPSFISKGMFPQPPQLFEKDDMVTRSL